MSKAQVHQVVKKVTPSERGKSPCVHKSVYRGHTVDPVPCYNRFDPLKQFDTQELDDQGENLSVVQTAHKVKPKVKVSKHSKSQKECFHKISLENIDVQKFNDSHRSGGVRVDPVPCHGHCLLLLQNAR